MGFWETDVVSEDSRIFWQSYLHFDGDYEITPMFLPVSMDTCLDQNIRKTLKNQYKQVRRWAWGAENIPYLLYGFVKNNRIRVWDKIAYAFRQIEGMYIWATSAIILAVFGWLPIVVGGEAFSSSVLAYNLPQATMWISLLAICGLIVSAGISTVLLPPRPKEFPKLYSPWMFLQWIFLPLASIFFGAIPAIDAQTRLILKRWFGLGFWVTPKVRKDASCHVDLEKSSSKQGSSSNQND
jgi:hypothetical protein